MLLVITPNVALERTWVIPGIRLGGVFHVQEALLLPSGKGNNAARAIKQLGGAALCMGYLAGHTGRLVAELARAQGLTGDWTWIEGETRVAVALVDPESADGDATLMSEAGPTVSPADWERLVANIHSRINEAEMVGLSGSMPPATPLDGLVGLIRSLEAHCPVWVDSSGLGLEAAARAGASGIKVNAQEIGALLGMPVHDFDSALKAGRSLLAQVGAVVVTLGKNGAVMVTPDGACMAEPPKLRALSAVGSGDAFFGALLLALAHGECEPDALRQATAAGAANAMTLGGGRFRKTDYTTALTHVVVKEIG